MNMRKIVAIMASVLMLFSVIPMGALSVSAYSANFEDGTAGWASDCGVAVENIDGSNVLVWNANLDWANMYNYCNLSANTEYVMTMKVKADRDTDMNFKVLSGDWGSVPFVTTFGVSTEWQEISVQFNTGDNGNFVMLSTNTEGIYGATYYVDDFSIEEYVAPAVPGQIVNGDFETGDADGWNLPQSGSVKAEAAHDGSYGINVKGGGSYGGMLDQTIPVNAGKSYEISFWLKVNANGINAQIKDGDTSGANIAGGWYDMNKAGNWTQFSYIVIPTTDLLTINFCGAGNSIAEDAYIDTVIVKELKEPSFDGYITNGDFETGDTQSWESVWNSAQLSIVDGRNGGSAMQINYPGQWQVVRQKVAVKPNTNYVYGAYTKNCQGAVLLVKSAPADQNINQAGISNSDDWKKHSVEFNSGDCSEVYLCVMSNNGGDHVIVDDFFIFEKVEASNDGYLINGTFETGDIAPWDNLWGSCPKAEVIKGGLDSNFALEIISGQWKHVRQTNIAVEANTNYKITAWAKNASGMSLLVKDGSDSKDLVNAGVSAGDEWTEFTAEFNTGDYTTIIFSLMGNQAEAYGIFDNIKIEKVVAECEHNYEITNGEFATCETDGWAEYTCSICGDVKTETLPAYHNGGMEYNPAKEAIDCANPGNIENYYCPVCNEYFADAYAQEIINPWYIQVTVECVKPEGLADCAGWTCETCGNENFGSGEHDVLVCQGGTCSKCNAVIEGAGCQNFDTPACQDGVCYYCGGFVAGFGHENGATEPCVDGECAYGCGLTYPAAEDHVDEDGNDYCDNCWNHLACIDEDGDGWCDLCWREMPVADVIYGDADGDGEVTLADASLVQQFLAGGDVTVVDGADADGDGEVTLADASLIQQFLAGGDVTLGG